MKFDCFINGTPRNIPVSKMKFVVPASECIIAGTWVNGKPWEPERKAFRESLPSRWRKAFDRACDGLAFWHDSVPGRLEKGKCHISLSDRRGRYLATVYCVPAKEESRV